MSRFARILATLAILSLSACEAPSTGEIASTDQPIVTSCQGTPPSSVTWPLTTYYGQAIFCGHQPTDFQPSDWAYSTGLCIGAPGLYQVDIVVRSDEASPHFWCARVDLSNVGGDPLCGGDPDCYSLAIDFQEILERGWRSDWGANGAFYRRKIVGLTLGNKTTAVVSDYPHVYSQGAPYGRSVGRANNGPGEMNWSICYATGVAGCLPSPISSLWFGVTI